MKAPPFTFVPVCILLLASCQTEPDSPLSHLEDQKILQTLEGAFHQCGSWERYSDLSSISYQKRSILFDSLGNVESDLTELHHFTFGNEPEAKIISLSEGGDSVCFISNRNGFEKRVNGNLVDNDSQEIIRKVNSSLYSLLMPWKLLDAGTQLHYAGKDTLHSSLPCHVVEAIYEDGGLWRYYFDQNSYKYVAAWASHGAFGALVMNDSTTTNSGLTLNTCRTTFRTWKDQAPVWRRALFRYTDIKLTFNDN